MKKARPLIFSVSTYDSNVSMHTKNQFPGFIQFFLLYDQNYVFQTKNVICVNYEKIKKARLMISSMNTCYIYVSSHAKHQPPSFIHFFLAYCQKGIKQKRLWSYIKLLKFPSEGSRISVYTYVYIHILYIHI